MHVMYGFVPDISKTSFWILIIVSNVRMQICPSFSNMLQNTISRVRWEIENGHF